MYKLNIPFSKRSEFHIKGDNAFDRGMLKSNNPYSQSVLKYAYKQWNDGWDYGKGLLQSNEDGVFWSEGLDSFNANKSKSINPYKAESDNFNLWLDGWECGEGAYKQKQKNDTK